MSRIRFATAHAVFEAFPEIAQKLRAKPSKEQVPIEFLKVLASRDDIQDAVTFCAYLLPRREAVWWACGCTRALLAAIPSGRAAGLTAAEAWVYEPDDAHRQAALEVGNAGDGNDPQTWLARAAGWAGGVLSSTAHKQIPMPQYMTPRAVRIAVLLSCIGIRPAERVARLRTCISHAIQLAETGL